MGIMKTATVTEAVKKIARAAYPDYKGRKFIVAAAAEYQMADYWDGGTRRYARAAILATGEFLDPASIVHVPYNREAHVTIQIPAGVAIVERLVFCGKDCGVTVYVGAADTKSLESLRGQNMLTP